MSSKRSRPWLSERTSKPRLINPQHHLIITEGGQTEPRYFQSMKAHISKNLGSNDRGQLELFKIKPGVAMNEMFDMTAQYMKHQHYSFQHVWFVYDKDDLPPDTFNQMERACQMQSSPDGIQYHALWSNECFELWFLLHFIPLNTPIPRDQYITKLTEHLGKRYSKTDAAMFNTLLPHLESAISRARSLDERSSSLPPAQNNPCTKVYQLFDYFLPYVLPSIRRS